MDAPGRAPLTGRRWRWPVLALVAAIVTAVAVAVALALVSDAPNGRVAAPASLASFGFTGPTDMPVPAGVPGYYAALAQADTGRLLVGDTTTGQVIATVQAPPDEQGVSNAEATGPGVTNAVVTGVYGTADSDDEFIVTTGYILDTIGEETNWYLLTITPAGSRQARLTPLPIPALPGPTGVALSPDGSKLAVALPGTPAMLEVFATATGRRLRAWSTMAPGQITAEKLSAGSLASPATSLRWSADGRQLAFAWNGAGIRVLSATAPDGNLLTASRLLAGIGTGYGLDGASYTCDAVHGWALIAGGQGTICAGGLELDSSSCADGKCTPVTQVYAGFLRQTPYGQGGSETEVVDRVSGCPDQAQPGEGAYLSWANADGSVLIGSYVCGRQSRFGAIRGNGFAPLPAPPKTPPLPFGVLSGPDAW